MTTEKLSDQIMAILENIEQNKLLEAKLDLCVLWGTAKIQETQNDINAEVRKQLDVFEKQLKTLQSDLEAFLRKL
jgi:hypothetical protein